MSTNSLPLQQLGRYDLVAKIAEGGMGAVYKGVDRETGRIVAIKVIPPETARSPLHLKRFEQEFKAATLIDHPNVVQALEYCGTGPMPFLVMEFVDGVSLGERVARDGPLPECEAVAIISRVCEGLHRAHKQGLIHRDVKPDNIMIGPDGIVKLTDLGLVKDIEDNHNLTRTGRGLGTPHYMAPEQFRDAKNADPRFDVYSLGATLYTLVTGVVPFAGLTALDCWMKKVRNDLPEPRELNRLLSPRVNWAIIRAMSAQPEQRPPSCREFMEDLTGLPWRAGSSAPASTESVRRPAVADLWYLAYRDRDGVVHTVKGSTDGIRRNIISGELSEVRTILVCRSKTGQFQLLQSVPEFSDLVSWPGIDPTPPALAASSTIDNVTGFEHSPVDEPTGDPPPSRPATTLSAAAPADSTSTRTGWWPWLLLALVTVVAVAAGVWLLQQKW